MQGIDVLEDLEPLVLCRCFDVVGPAAIARSQGRARRSHATPLLQLRPKSESAEINPGALWARISRDDSAENLPFVNSTGPKLETDAQTRKKIRAHVMNDFQRKRTVSIGVEEHGHASSNARRVSPVSQHGPPQLLKPSSNISTAASGEQAEEFQVPTALLMKSGPVNHDDSLVFVLPLRTNQTVFLSDREISPTTPDPTKCPFCGNTRSRSDYGREFTPQELQYLQKNAMRRSLSSMGASRSDPFDMLPMHMTKVSQENMDHYVQRFSRRCFNPLIHWSDTMSDRLLLHSALYISSMHRKAVGLPETLSSILFHRGELMQLINKRLAEPDQRANDSVISSVMSLAAMQCLNWKMSGETVKEFELHFSCVEALVNLRGGLEILGMDGLLAKQIRWIDVCHANLTASPLRFPVETPVVSLGMLNTTDSLTSDFLYLRQQFDETSTILKELRSLTVLLEERRRVGLSESESRHPITIHHEAIALELRAIMWTHRHKLEPYDDRQDALTSFHIVMNIYIYLVFRTVAINCSYFDFQASRLKGALEMLSNGEVRVQYPSDLLLWTLFIGGIASRTERSWFTARFVECCHALKVDTWEKVKTILVGFPWIEQYFQPLGKAFWNGLDFTR